MTASSMRGVKCGVLKRGVWGNNAFTINTAVGALAMRGVKFGVLKCGVWGNNAFTIDTVVGARKLHEV